MCLQLLLINNGKWRVKGNVTTYSKTSSGQGAASGTGDVYWWDTSLNGGLGDWALAQKGVSYTINFYDSGTSGKSSSDTFGIRIVYTPVVPQPSAAERDAAAAQGRRYQGFVRRPGALGHIHQKRRVTMSTEANKAIARRFLEEAFGQGNLAVVDEIIAPNQVNGGPGVLPGMPSGPEGAKMLITNYRNAFPDLHFTIDEQVAEGNTVVTRWAAHGTNTGELAGLPVAGLPATVVGVGVDRIENGKIVESWGIFDQFGMLQQLGVIPTESPA